MAATSFEMHWVQQPGSRIVEIHRPTSIEQALQLRAERPELRPVAGGTDLILDLARDGRAGDVGLLDLTGIDGFDDIVTSDDTTVLSGGVTHNAVIANDALVERALPLAQACLEVGSPQLRNRATIAGNLVTASPANDTISALLALGASVELAHVENGEVRRRMVRVEDFFVGFRSTVCAENELIVAIHVPHLRDGERGLWVKLGLRRAQAISVVHAGLTVLFDDGDTVLDARLALGSVGPTVQLCPELTAALVGKRLDAATIDAAAQAAAASVSPIDDGRATAEYRSSTVATVVARALHAVAQGDERAMWPERPALLTVRPDSAAPASRTTPKLQRASVLRTGDAVTATVNGLERTSATASTATLLEWLRAAVGTGTKEGCAEGECGACTVRVDGDAVMSCLVPAAQVEGSDITTIEGLQTGEAPHEMQKAFVDHFAVQCGFCIPGFVVSAATLAEEIPQPSRAEIEFALAGNLCRCTGYYSIIDAVQAATQAEVGT